jgi:Na+-transporting methylmalonyl-CoA/oxaloacetate decarboxylase gamma subunit
MGTAVIIIIVLLLAAVLVYGSQALRRYWDEETNMSDEDHAFDRRVATYNTSIANTQRDEDIVRALRGQDMPTVADRYPRREDRYYEDEE